MNGRQAAKLAAKKIEELEYIAMQNKLDIQDYNKVIEDQIDGKSPCPWCEDYAECQLDAKDGFGCHEWMLRYRSPEDILKGGDPDGPESGGSDDSLLSLEEQ